MDFIRERTPYEIVNDAKSFIFRNVFYLIAAFAPITLPHIISYPYLFHKNDEYMLGLWGFTLPLFAIFAYGTTVLIVSDICIGDRPRISTVYMRVLQSYWRLLATNVIFILSLFFSFGPVLQGFPFLVPVGIVAFFWWIFSTPVCIIERRSPFRSLYRSYQIGKNFRLRNAALFGYMLLSAGFIFMVSVGAFFMMKSIASKMFFLSEEDFVMTTVSFLIMFLSLSFAFVFMYVSLVIAYYDMRVRNEGYDTAALTQELMAQ